MSHAMNNAKKQLQRGRTPESAERSVGGAWPVRLRGFNGAALRRVRREARAYEKAYSAAKLQRGRTPESAERFGD